MALITTDQLVDLLGPNATIAGLDLGTKTIGVAVSDSGLVLAHPRQVVRRTKFTNDANGKAVSS
jgi:putative holliday junction resolvase